VAAKAKKTIYPVAYRYKRAYSNDFSDEICIVIPDEIIDEIITRRVITRRVNVKSVAKSAHVLLSVESNGQLRPGYNFDSVLVDAQKLDGPTVNQLLKDVMDYTHEPNK
jgi:hypothetical protein